MSFFPLLNTKEDILKHVGVSFDFHMKKYKRGKKQLSIIFSGFFDT